jgi:hypothetical protein
MVLHGCIGLGEEVSETSCASDIAGAFGEKHVSFKLRIRQLDGLEMLALVGIPFEDIKEFPTHELGSRMAGNAFSAFAVGPVLLAALIGMTRSVVLQKPRLVLFPLAPSSDDED